MPSKDENLPVHVDLDLHNGGTIKYANEVIAIIAGVAATEVEGIAGMVTSGGIGDIIGRNRNITRGVKVDLGSEEASVDLYITVEYGTPIHKVAAEVQENVRKAIESMTGLHVVKVDVHVQGVSFEKENKERDAAIESARKPALEEGEAKPKKARSRKPKEAPKAEQPAPADGAAQEAPAAEEAPAADSAPAQEGEAPAPQDEAPQE